MPSPEIDEVSVVRNARIAALHALASGGLTDNHLATTEPLLSLLPKDAVPDPVKRLMNAFGDAAKSARKVVVSSKDRKKLTAHEREARCLAAVGELLGQTDHAQFLERLGGRSAEYRRKLDDCKSEWDERKLRAAIWAGCSDRTVERYIKLPKGPWYSWFLTAIERHLLIKPQFQTQSVEAKEPERSDLLKRPGYVTRECEEAEFHRLVEVGAKLITFVGQPGIGKTSVACALAPDAPVIRFANDRPNPVDIARALGERGVPSGEHVEDLEGRLVQLVVGDRAPRVVVLDNLENSDVLREILPYQGADSFILATSRIRGNAPHKAAQFVEVGKMSAVQGASVARLNNAFITDDEAEGIAEAFDGYPLVIGYVATLALKSGLSVSQLIENIRREARGIASKAYTEEGRHLLAALRRLVQLIKEEDSLAYRLLTLVVWCDYPPLVAYVDRYSVMFGWREDASQVAFAEALLCLERYSLIEVRRPDRPVEDDPRFETSVGIQAFTQDVLRQEFVAELNQIIDTTLRGWPYETSGAFQRSALVMMPRCRDLPLEPKLLVRLQGWLRENDLSDWE